MANGNPTENIVQGVGAVTTASVAWRFKGQLNLTVIVKATFGFAHDAAMPRAAPEPVLPDDVSHSKLPGRSTRFAGNRAPYLGSADVTYTGFACSPGRPVRSMFVRLGVYRGQAPLLDKVLLVQSDEPFESLPLLYERAYGGLPDHPENPFGCGSDPGLPAPNVLHPEDPKRIAGYGPIARIWPTRRRLLGSMPREALDEPVAEIPDGFDWSYFQAAPADQQLPYLQGDEWILLDGLHPSQASVRMRLPDVRGLARVYGLGVPGVVEGQGLVLAADTLHIDGAEGRCMVVWRRSFPVPHERAFETLRVHAGVEAKGEPLVWPEPQAASAHAPPAAPAHAPPVSAARPSSKRAVAIEDKVASPGEDDDVISISTVDLIPDEPVAQASHHPLLTTLDLPPGAHAPMSLPFQAGPSALEQPLSFPEPPRERNPALSVTLKGSPLPGLLPPPLPFQGVSAPAPATPPPPPPSIPPPLPDGFRDAAPAPPATAPEPPKPSPSWAWREEPEKPAAPPPPQKKAPIAAPKVDVGSVLYGGKKRRR